VIWVTLGGAVDEFGWNLFWRGDQRQVPVAGALALKLKQALRAQIGECLSLSSWWGPPAPATRPTGPDGTVLCATPSSSPRC
jgi:hypothetical protein